MQGFALVRGLLIIALVSGAASAQSVSFETPNLLQGDLPPGIFSTRFVPTMRMPQSIQVELDGGHRGNGALVVRDGHRGTGAATQALLTLQITGTPTRRARFWLRVEPGLGTGTTAVLSMIGSSVTHGELLLDRGATTLDFIGRCEGVNGDLRGAPHALDGGWHLVELGVVGLGTATGHCVVTFDGVEEVLPRDFTGRTWEVLVLGLPYGDSDLTGAYFFDDFELTQSQPTFASKLALEFPDAGEVGACIEGVVRARSASDEARAVSSRTAITFGAPDITFFGSGCVGDAGVVLGPGDFEAPFSFRQAVSGRREVRANADDLIGVVRPFIAFQPDAGTDAGVDAGVDAGTDAGSGEVDAGVSDAGTPEPQREHYGVGCGCSGVDFLAIAALGALLMRRRDQRDGWR